MIIFSHKCGQLGNRLFAFAHLIASAEAENFQVVNLSFEDYAEHFTATQGDLFCRYPRRKSWIVSTTIRKCLFIFNKAIVKLLRIVKMLRGPLHTVVIADLPEFNFRERRYFDLKNEVFQKLVHEKPLVFLFGRFFRDYENAIVYQDKIREHFRPIARRQHEIDTVMRIVGASADLVVGVHIRRGDYAQFADGRYFYDDDQYEQWMSELEMSFPGTRVAFVICSNEKINDGWLSRRNYFAGPGHLVSDMYALAACDLILGPPSTFSLWAAFYGKKPIWQIRDRGSRASLENFVVPPPEVLLNFSFN